jgi:hypothetical protein
LLKTEFDSNFEPNSRGRSRIDLASTSVLPLIARKVREIRDEQSAIQLMGPLENSVVVAQKQPLASKWGLDDINKWKLSREFIAAYPCFDCRNGGCSHRTDLKRLG